MKKLKSRKATDSPEKKLTSTISHVVDEANPCNHNRPGSSGLGQLRDNKMSRGPGKWQRVILAELASRESFWLRTLLPGNYTKAEYNALHRAALKLGAIGPIKVHRWWTYGGTGEDVNHHWLRHSLETAGYVFGLPTGQAAQSLQYLWDVWSGDQDPEDVKEFMQGWCLRGRSRRAALRFEKNCLTCWRFAWYLNRTHKSGACNILHNPLIDFVVEHHYNPK